MHQFCTFRLDGHLYGIDVQHVQEVLCHIAVTDVPLASNLVHGLINLRGQIVAAIDLRGCLGLPARSDRSPVSVIVCAPGGPLSFQADEIGDVLSLEPRNFEATPPVAGDPPSELLSGVYKLSLELLRVLNVPAAVSYILARRTENVVDGTGGLAIETPHAAG